MPCRPGGVEADRGWIKSELGRGRVSRERGGGGGIGWGRVSREGGGGGTSVPPPTPVVLSVAAFLQGMRPNVTKNRKMSDGLLFVRARERRVL